jgi:ketosteroid isomerase-like protein
MNWMRNSKRLGSDRSSRRSVGTADFSSLTLGDNDLDAWPDFDVSFVAEDNIFMPTGVNNIGDIHFAPDADGIKMNEPSMIASSAASAAATARDYADTPSLTTTDEDTLEGDHSDRVLDASTTTVVLSEDMLKRQVREAVDRSSLAWNMGNLQAYLDGYTEDVRYVNAVLFQSKGQMSISGKSNLSFLFQSASGRIENMIEEINMMGTEHAEVFGRYQHGRNQGVFTLIMVKQRGQWLIRTKHASAMPQVANGNTSPISQRSEKSTGGGLRSSGSTNAKAAAKRASTSHRTGAH